MCIGIYPATTSSRITIPFAIERIYQKRDGWRWIITDVQVMNAGDSPVDRLQMIFPDAMVDVGALSKRGAALPDEDLSAFVMNGRATQLSLVHCRNADLLVQDHPNNWIFAALDHLECGGTQNKTLTIKRKIGEKFEDSSAIVKLWELEQPQWMVDDAWLLYSHSNLSSFCLLPKHSRDILMPGEKMWLRIEINVPARPENRHRFATRFFARSVLYWNIFRTPGAIHELFCNMAALNIGGLTECSHEYRAQLAVAQREAVNFSPALCTPVEDWRTLFYGEYGLSIERVEWRGGISIQAPRFSSRLRIPAEAEPEGCLRGPLPHVLQWLLPNTRRERCEELWFGSKHGSADDASGSLDIETRSMNEVYTYLVWMSLIVGLTSLSMNLYRWWNG
jgi:hypothetical protein